MTIVTAKMRNDLQEIVDRVLDDSAQWRRPLHEVLAEAIAEYLGKLPESLRMQERSRMATARAYHIIKMASRFDERIAAAETEEESDTHEKLQEEYRQWLLNGPGFHDEKMKALEMVFNELAEEFLAPGGDNGSGRMTSKMFRQEMDDIRERMGEKPDETGGNN